VQFHFAPVGAALDRGEKAMALNLPGCRGILSHFTQPDRIFADELSDRLKVIACIEKPNMIHSEEIGETNFNNLFPEVAIWLSAEPDDAQIILWGPEEDIPTAIETVDERIRIALTGVPNETRKAFEDGTTMFERVLPGRDRMYPDTDSQPLPVTTEMLERLGRNLPAEIALRFRQMKDWGIPEDAWHYLLSKNLVVLIERIGNDFGFSHREVGVLIGHRFRSLEGRGRVARGFSYERLYDLFAFLKAEELLPPVARLMLPDVVATGEPDFKMILSDTGYAPASLTEIRAGVKELVDRFKEIRYNGKSEVSVDWIMGQLQMKAIGRLRLSEVRKEVSEILEVN
jgi:glutamyl-tRNA(Gln) amidotransferase subunit E